jgi:hypothetical protein
MQVHSTVVDTSNRIEMENVGGKIMEFSEFATQKLLEATGQSEHLTDREKQLIGLAVTATRGCIACRIRPEKALGRNGRRSRN